MIISGCSGDQEKREYTVPDSACGTSINAKALSPFLPSGEKLTSEATSNPQGVAKCSISVDGKLIVQTSQEWWNDMSILQFARGMTLDDPNHQTDDGKYAYSGYQAFGKAANCQNSKHKEQVLFTAVQAPGSKHRDAAAMKQLIAGFTKAAESSTQCN
ncbi:hypothetical protein P1P68_11750 [Streptomyces scabiei]|uniref:hypothetical protein n=2 Tax=Streptomyces TaxID=1883 RepID=UPI00299022DE|nr:hypothetical protein [Streptomyces scabiei]MDW8805430.1 hypothetical protein [Streptomyces scabiei]